MNVKDYLDRIRYSGELTPTLITLKQLQEQHLLNVPFENLDIHYGHNIVLDEEQFYNKIVSQNRGGFCYELNGLFRWLLNELGFKVKIISARVYDHGSNRFGPEFDHLALIVTLQQVDYLLDVGFGEFAFHPLRLVSPNGQSDPRGIFMIDQEAGNYTVSKLVGGAKKVEYTFRNQSRALLEFQGMCNFHQTSQESHFTQKKLITKPTINGRVTLTGNTLKITENGIPEKEVNFPVSEYADQLDHWFNLEEAVLKVGG